ncbi:hypothetical protein CBF32_03260 [Vagococcus fluvialis]|uniref:Uncharacterized protein n=1 Tax=Vagococcus fluvialis TaxID=2738 RepID=A0A430AB23_9ENTE|nr:hypothetical protein CBF32_03260 [Vagococcus fluvialis]
MPYLDKLKKVQGNLENLDNKSKDEVIKFAQLIVKMSIKKRLIAKKRYQSWLINFINCKKYKHV